MSKVRLVLAEGQCCEFERMIEGEVAPCFAVQWEGRQYAYRNSCPHTGAPLNWQPNNFLNFEGDLIQCALHGALFRIEDGVCLHGPCLGRQLERVALPQNEPYG